MPIPGYKVRKAAQVAAYFARREGGRINVLKLTKLIYLADREALNRYDFPILYDKLVSMEHGPVDSTTLNFTNNLLEDASWSSFLAGRAGLNVAAVAVPEGLDPLDELSDAEVGVLEAIWDKFGWMDRFQLRDYTHKHCPEWEDPKGSSAEIPYGRVLKFLGKEDAADAIAEGIEEDRKLLALGD